MFESHPNRWWILAGCTSGLVVVSGTINAFPIAVFLKPVGQDLGLSRSVLSSGIMLTNVLCGLTTPFVGGLFDRYGSRRILLLGIPLFAASVAAFSLLQSGLLFVYSLSALAGLAGATHNTVPYTKVITRWFDNERGLALGIGLSGIGFGIIVVPQIAQLMIEHFGWRLAYVGVGGVIMMFAFLPVLLFVREPSQTNLANRSSGVGGLPGLAAREVFTTQWRFWVMAISFFLAVIATNGTLIHVVAMLTDRGMSVPYATAVLSCAGLGLIFGRMGCGFCLDRYSGPCVAACFFVLPALGIGMFAMGVGSHVLFLGGALCGAGLGANITVMAFFVGRYFGLKAYGRVFGLMFGIFLIGTGVGPYLNALSHDHLSSYQPALFGSIACLLVAALLLAWLGPYSFGLERASDRSPVTLNRSSAPAVAHFVSTSAKR